MLLHHGQDTSPCLPSCPKNLCRTELGHPAEGHLSPASQLLSFSLKWLFKFLLLSYLGLRKRVSKGTHLPVLKKATSFLPWVSLPPRWPVFYERPPKAMPNTERDPSARSFPLISPSVSLFTVVFWWFSFFFNHNFRFSKRQRPPASPSLLCQRPLAPSGGRTPSQARRSVQTLRSSKREPAFVSSELLCRRALHPDPSDVQIPQKPRKVESYCGR